MTPQLVPFARRGLVSGRVMTPLPDLPVTSETKRNSHAQARAALCGGIVLNIIDGDNGRPLYVANLHAMTRCFDAIGEVEAWLDKIGAPK